MSYTVVSGNLLDADTEYIVQQNCCTACKPDGLSAAIIEKFPYANPYKNRRKIKGKQNWAIKEDRAMPGSIQIFDKIVCMFAQYCQGKPGKYKDPLELDTHDTASDRLMYFKDCLENLSLLNPKRVGFPYKIGCGLAGGDWKLYEPIIKEWSSKYMIDVVIYKL
jgi:hypothetical protein